MTLFLTVVCSVQENVDKEGEKEDGMNTILIPYYFVDLLIIIFIIICHVINRYHDLNVS